MQPIPLSPSQIITADTCRRQHGYRSIARIRTRQRAANLAFGEAVDLAVRAYLLALATDAPRPDPVAVFSRGWRAACQAQTLTYAASQRPEDFAAMGEGLLALFPAAWAETGLTLARDGTGGPLLDLELAVSLGGGVSLTGVLDLVVYTPAGALALLDVKSASSAHTLTFARRADQLTAYQLLLDAHAARLGLPKVGRLGFLDLLKRKRSPSIAPPLLVPRRTAAELDELVQKAHWLAEDIRRGRFPRSSRHAFNSPCTLCEYAGHCIEGDATGLVFPQERTGRVAGLSPAA
jgi:RecB family exonuclease